MSSGWAFSLYNKFASWYQCFSLSKRHYLAVSKMKSTLNFKTRIVIFFHVSIWQIPQYNYNIIKPYYFRESLKSKTQLNCVCSNSPSREATGVWKTKPEPSFSWWPRPRGLKILFSCFVSFSHFVIMKYMTVFEKKRVESFNCSQWENYCK